MVNVSIYTIYMDPMGNNSRIHNDSIGIIKYHDIGILTIIIYTTINGWWFGTFFIFPYIIYWTNIFQRGRSTTNQLSIGWFFREPHP